MFYQIKKYFSFLLKSTNKHGVHSPFVFDLVTQCFDIKTDVKLIEKLDVYQKYLKTNNQEIKVNDFGAGSRVFKTDKRLVSAIYKHVSISKKHAALLIRFVAYFESNTILELGTSLGVGALSLALGNKKATIITLEGCKETLAIPEKELKKHTQNTIEFIEGKFSATLPNALKKHTYDLIYFDGNHQKQATIDYFEQCLDAIHNNSIFIFDDIYWNLEMTEAWEYIKNHEKVSLTIDTYHFGFVFFRKEQFQKEHFVIRL